jgi:hypothetical protein
MSVAGSHSRIEDSLARAQMRDLDSAEPALEVIVLWGDQSVLHVAHLSPPRAFYVGDTPANDDSAVDLVLGAESLGRERLPITLQAEGDSFAVIPEGADGYVMSGEQVLSLPEAAALGYLERCDELAGASQCRLSREMSARIEYRGFTFLVRPTLAARRVGVGGGLAIDWKTSRFTLSSVLLHLGLLVLFYFAPPSSTVLAIDRMNLDSRMVDYLVTPDVTPDPDPAWDSARDAQDNGGSQGKAHEGEDGQSGKRDAPKTKHRIAIAGPADNRDPEMARDAARKLIEDRSIIAVLRSNVGNWNTPTSPYGRNEALNSSASNAIGALFGQTTGENFGFGGIGMHGPGHGGGGNAQDSIGVGVLGTRGRWRGDDGPGYGTGVAGLRGHNGTVPRVRISKADIRGSLSKEVIRRTVQLHLNEVRHCYEQGLNARPDLQGRVAVKFVIGASGAVTIATRADSDVGERGVESCIVDAVGRWTFPAPEGGGIVIVTYPFVLQQAGG